MMVGLGLSFGVRQQRKLSQTLTPLQHQSVKLLQLSNIGLDTLVREALETNPLLSLDEPADDDAVESPKMPARSPTAGYRPTPAVSRLFGAAEGTPPKTGKRKANAGARGPDEPGAVSETTLQDALLEDIAFSFANAAERAIAIDLSFLLDDSGYLAGDVGDVAACRGVSAAKVTDILLRLQALAPAGLFARNLGECLRLQLVDAGTLDPPMEALLDNLPLLTERGPETLAAAAGIDPGDLPQYLQRLRALDPRPGRVLAGAAAPAIVPDLIVRPALEAFSGNGEFAHRIGRWIVAVNPETAPDLSLDRAGLATLRAQSRSRTDRAYVSDMSREASWLIQAVRNRRTTVLRLGVEIFRRQQEFLEHGTARLGPLTRKEIARAAGLHESTISRAVNEKYAATPQGVFALKFLFSGRIRALDGGPGHAASAVRHRLRVLIDRETTPLSDEALARLLRADGYDLARRTVTKYREMLRIPSSVERRRRLAYRPAEKFSACSS